MRLHFLVYLVLDGKSHLKGRVALDLKENLKEGYDFDEMRKNLIEVGKVFIEKHFKKDRDLSISFVDEKTEHSEYLVFEYFVKAKKAHIVFRYVDRLGYWLSKFVPFLFR